MQLAICPGITVITVCEPPPLTNMAYITIIIARFDPMAPSEQFLKCTCALSASLFEQWVLLQPNLDILSQ